MFFFRKIPFYLGGNTSKAHEFIIWTPLHADVDIVFHSGTKCESLGKLKSLVRELTYLKWVDL